MSLFLNRRQAGRVLGEQVKRSLQEPNVLVLALPRGGVPVGFEVARALDAEMDIFMVRKLGVPGQEELAFGALASGGIRVLNYELIEHLHVSQAVIDQIAVREQAVLETRERGYLEGRTRSQIAGRSVVLVDDGLATGASMMAAVRAVKRQGAREVIVAVPVAARETCSGLEEEADRVICSATPYPFSAVGAWYEDFTQVADEEVRKLLEQGAPTVCASKIAQNASN
jgi:putative phosphoribosyl transferase